MLVVIGFVVAVNFMIWKLFDDIAYHQVLRELEHSVLSYQRFTTRHQDLLTTQARAIAETAHLKATLNIPDVDHETVQVVTESLLDVANPDILFVVNDSGEVLGNANVEKQFLHNIVNYDDVQQALSGQLVINTWSTPSGVYRIAIAPSAIGGNVFGAVIVGYQLDNAQAIQELNDVTGSSVQFHRADKNEAQDPTLTVTTAIDGIPITSIENIPLYEFSNQNRRLLFANIKIPGSETSILLLKELDAAASSIDPIKIAVAAGSVIAILLGLLISNFLALKVSRPITSLTDAASRFGKGEFSTRVTKESDDEVGVLAETFNLMANDISTTQKNLLASKEAAEAANRAKSDFLAKMSHEIRTPMNGVIGITELLLRTNLSEKQQKFGETITRSANSLLTIINDILDFSKIEAGKLELEHVEFDLKEIVEDTVDLLKEIASNKGINLVSKFQHATPLFVFGDPNRLRQVLNNLIHNAIKFTEKGDVTIQAQIKRPHNSTLKIEVTFEVIDTGIGISEKNQIKIFNSFAQADDSTTREYGGTGLGLTICQQLVNLMGGSIEINSKPGKGSNFNFRLQFKLSDKNHILDIKPNVIDKNLIGNKELITNTKRSIPKEKNMPAHILLVDDDPINRDVAMGMLSDLGCEITVAMNGIEAIENYQLHTHDLILMDCNMPEMDGYSATQEIRNLESEHNIDQTIPIIALTANAMAGDRLKCLESGMSDYLSKPYTYDELKKALNKWIGLHVDDNHENNGSLYSSVSLVHQTSEKDLEKNQTQPNTPDIEVSILDDLEKLPHPSKLNVAEAAVMNYLIYASKVINDLHHTNKVRSPRLSKTLAHSLKSASCSVGAMRVAELCNQLEKISHDTANEALQQLLDDISESYKRVTTILESYLINLRENKTHSDQVYPSSDDEKSSDHRLKILLAEDNSINREVAVGMLEDMGYSVASVFNGAQAIQTLQDQHYDLLLMDCQMPEMDGYHATKIIRILQEQGKIHKELIIIAITANALHGDRERCLAAGMDDYISKPYTYDDLNNLVKRWHQDRPPEKTQEVANESSAICTAEAIEKVKINTSMLERLYELEQSVSLDYSKNLASKYINKASTKMISDLEKAISDKDFDAIERTSQNLRASTIDLGANYLGELCLRIEKITKYKNIEEIESLLKNIKNECQEIVTVLNLYLENNKVAQKISNHAEADNDYKEPVSINGNVSILLAEDNPINQDVAIGMLKNLGYTVTTVNNGHDAIETFKSILFDLVLLDCHMPKVDGLTATGYMRLVEIRRNSEKRTPIIAITANALEGDRERCIAAGMDDFISKPYSQDQLQDVIKTWLAGCSKVA